MNRIHTTLTASRPGLPLAAVGGRPLAMAAAVLVGTGVLTASSWLQVPMVPVPMTLQTLAVTMLGACLGWRLAAATVAAWLAEAALGLPVLAGGHAGLVGLVGPTAGYLAAFLIAAAAVGWAAGTGVLARSPAHSFLVMLLANLGILALGALWLVHFMPSPSAAIAAGVTPFLVGGVVKAALATALCEAARLRVRAKR